MTVVDRLNTEAFYTELPENYWQIISGNNIKFVKTKN